MEDYSKKISEKLKLPVKSAAGTIRLLEDGNTVPFISRYRKEATGGLDETVIRGIEKEIKRLGELDARKKTVTDEISRQGKLSEEIYLSIAEAESLFELEDIYLPYKPKRKTKADKAVEAGLEPLAKRIMAQADFDVAREAEGFLNEKITSTEDALSGARHIISQWVSEDRKARQALRAYFKKEAVVASWAAGKKSQKAAKYRDYFDYREHAQNISSHRFLAINRGSREGFLKMSILPGEDGALDLLEDMFLKEGGRPSREVKLAVKDSYRRLISPSIENELLRQAKEEADSEAIAVFAKNLRQILLAPLLGPKRILALDPGFRTGCKAVCLDEKGELLYNDTIYPHPPVSKGEEAARKVKTMVDRFDIAAVAIGNGTAGRETREFIAGLGLDGIGVFMVNEAGASVYSASEVAREEFPGHDVTVRGAVSIGRRLADPLAELVKIDPKSIGVGQYQHDVDQRKLKEALDQVVESCVNLVGVNLNTASSHLLAHVSGLGPKTAENIVEHRKKISRFTSREELEDVPKLGSKAFEQCAGFLRIEGGKNPLDSSAVHPESYHIVENIADDLGVKVRDMIGKDGIGKRVELAKYTGGRVGISTLKDIIAELAKPGRDPRKTVDEFEFRNDIRSTEDLKEGMVVKGIVTNITNFGAFVDIGIKNDGLIHISELSENYIKDCRQVVDIGQKVDAKVIGIDKDRGRISLSLLF